MLAIVIILLAVIADQITKYLALTLLNPIHRFVLIDGILEFRFVRNRGAAWGILADNRWVFMTISVISLIFLSAYLFHIRKESKLYTVPIALIIGGGIGNMIDRVLLGYVIDFIDFCAFPNLWKWVFNIADSCVCVGTFMLSLWLIVDTVKAYKLEKAKKEREE